jgi:molybdopterin-guanine dinucleotide biosynthesis protein A
MKKHQKHAKLTRPSLGNFARNEWSFIGTPCGEIKKLAFQLTQCLSKKYKVGYVDADHKSADEAITDADSAMSFGAAMEHTDKITFHRFDQKEKLEAWHFRQQFNGMDLVFVNGNHFKASQVVFIDTRKEDSLRRKLDRLTNVELIILQDDETEVFPFLKDSLENFEKIPVVSINNFEKIEAFFFEKMKAAKPKLYGLVLAGGKSTRMGRDKGMIDYHGKPQREYVFEMMDAVCEKTFLSFREGQEAETDLPVLTDTFKGLGPFGAMLSAFQKYPNQAWLVVACDLPLLDKKTLDYLIGNRNPSAIATAFYNPETDFPEPLITIWEPRSYPILYQFLAQGYSCPRKILINSEIELLKINETKVLKNVNKPEELAAVKKQIVK